MSDHDDFGDRMKMYENAEAGRRLMPLLPVCVRVDGRAFSTFTKGMERPYDPRLSMLMEKTTRHLAQETNARIAYTQSDEISLVLYSDSLGSEVYFDGRIQKMVSSIAAEATGFFVREAARFFDREFLANKRMPAFDCRVWNVPNKTEAANTILWREKDATKNSITMAASCWYSHKELLNKSGSEKQEMLFRKGVNWNDFPAFFKRGTFIQRKVTSERFTTEELEALPPMHEARRNPDLVVERRSFVVLAMPPFGKVLNREAVIFDGAEPVMAEET